MKFIGKELEMFFRIQLRDWALLHRVVVVAEPSGWYSAYRSGGDATEGATIDECLTKLRERARVNVNQTHHVASVS